MKRLLATLSVASILTAAPAAADYSACMKFCKEEHDFTYCHRICTESVGKMPDANTGVTGGEKHMKKGYRPLVGKTYEITNSVEDDSIIEVMRLGRYGHTDYMERSCLMENFCKGTTEMKDEMVESNLTCRNGFQFIRKFNLEEVSNFEQFTVEVYSGQWGINVGMYMDYVEIEDLSQATKLDCNSDNSVQWPSK